MAIVKSIPFGSLAPLQKQDCLYTVLLRGKQNGQTVEEGRVVTCVSEALDCYEDYAHYMALAELPGLRFVVSNTTEASIVYDENDAADMTPPKSYPGKLTQFLYRRWQAFAGAADKGLVVLPVELIENNGGKLRQCVLQMAANWQLPAPFVAWVEEACLFCSTLVDRIVTGYPRDEAESLWQSRGYEDELLVCGEPFALWVIESEQPEKVQAALPLDKAGLPVVFTTDQKPYRERKVRILNGGHTGMVLAAYLAGLDTVGECMADAIVRPYLEKMVYGEISPTVALAPADVKAFADSVMERFENPFIRHELLSIALNSVSKWKARVLPSLLDSLALYGILPPLLTFSFAALISFYRAGQKEEGALLGSREGNRYPIRDDEAVLDFFSAHAALPDEDYAQVCAGHTAFWGRDLNALPGFTQAIQDDLADIRTLGMKRAMEKVSGT